jgi:uncharacterized membrane protein YgdD (TMEM256/DUF423 family)
MEKNILATATLFGFFAIVLGAFGAHALKNYLTEIQLISFETGVRYLMYHALFLLFLGNYENKLALKTVKIVFRLVAIGVLLFSGSIFLLTTENLTGINFRFLGPITPIGGLFLISAWLLLFFSIINKKMIK